MAELFIRSAALNLGDVFLEIDPQDSDDLSKTLRFSFEVTRTLKKAPNQCSVKIFNFNKDNRTKLQQKDIPVIIEAGYKENRSIIFSGTLDYSQSILTGVDWETTLEAGDGSKNIRTKRVNKAFSAGTSVSSVVEEMVSSLGVGLGNLKKKLQEGGVRGVVSDFLNGAVLSGSASGQLDKALGKYGYSWSIQNGELLVLGPTDTLERQAININRNTGLLGSPEQGDKGFLKFSCLLQPEIVPGRKLFVESLEVEGGLYKTESVTYSGDTAGNNWFCNVEARPIS